MPTLIVSFFREVGQCTSSIPLALPALKAILHLVGACISHHFCCFGLLALFANATEAERDVLAS